MSIAYVTFQCFLRWLIRNISWLETLELAWHHQVMGCEKGLNNNNYPVSVLAWTTLCQQPGTEQCQLSCVQPRMQHLRYHWVTCLCHSLLTFISLGLSLFVLFSPCEGSVVTVGLPVQIWWHQQLLLSTLQFVPWEAKYLCWDHPGCAALPLHAKGQFCAFLRYKDSPVGSPGALRKPEALISFSKYTWADSGLCKSKTKAAIHEYNCLFARIL